MKIKINRSDKLKLPGKKGPELVPQFFSVDTAGKQVTITEKEHKYILDTAKRFQNVQALLKKKYEEG